MILGHSSVFGTGAGGGGKKPPGGSDKKKPPVDKPVKRRHVPKRGDQFRFQGRWAQVIAINEPWMGRQPPPARINHPQGILHTIHGHHVYFHLIPIPQPPVYNPFNPNAPQP